MRVIIALTVAVLGTLATLTAAASADLPRDRTIAFYNIHTKEALRIEYMRGGRQQPEAMRQINWILRDWRRNEPTTMDPKLVDLLWEVHAELGSKEPIHIISGYRSPATNAMLRNTVGGQASKSRHMIGSAADVHFPDVPVQRLRYSALIRERGGVGYYPTSAIPFVHVDTGAVRAWPRLPRRELALLFPNGETRHLPADGGRLAPDDAHRAKASGGALVAELASFHAQRANAGRTLLAAATTPAQPAASRVVPPLALAAAPVPAARPLRLARLDEPRPRLIAAPRRVERPAPPLTTPAALDRASLFQLAGLAAAPRPQPASRPAPPPKSVEAVAAVSAPAFDDEHPEELSYRPFPITPYLTATASFDDPALARLTAPDARRSLELLEAADALPPMHLRPGLHAAQALWNTQFTGAAVDVGAAMPRGVDGARRVATVAQ